MFLNDFRFAAVIAAGLSLVFASGSSLAADEMDSLVVAETAAALTCRDAGGGEVVLRKNPRRTVVHYSSLVGLWYLAGGEAVGRSDTANEDELPAAARDIAITGGFSSPNIERILALEPDLVILTAMDRHRSARAMLNDAGIDTVMLRYDNYGDFLHLLDLFCRLNGNSLAETATAAAVVAEVDGIISKTRGLEQPRFLCFMATSGGVNAETGKAHTAYIASSLGGRNIVDEMGVAPDGAHRIQLSMERVMMEDPDVILFTTMGDAEKAIERARQTMMSNSAWAHLKAVKNERVYFLPKDLFLFKPNERFPEAFRQMAEILYQRQFEGH